MTFYCLQSKNQTFYYGLQLLQQSNLCNSSVHHSTLPLSHFVICSLTEFASMFQARFFFFPQGLYTGFPAPFPSLDNSHSSLRFQLRHHFFHEIPLTSPSPGKDTSSITFSNHILPLELPVCLCNRINCMFITMICISSVSFPLSLCRDRSLAYVLPWAFFCRTKTKNYQRQ